MNDRFKFKIVVFERNYEPKTDWKFVEIIEDNNNWHLTMCGDIASNDCYYAHYRRNNAPDNVCRVYEPVFCTGKKDKNGKLIHEGDILKINTHLNHLVPDDFNYEYENEKGYSLFKVIYNDEFARFEMERIKWVKFETEHTRLGYIPTNHSIIGNIYENAELLEE